MKNSDNESKPQSDALREHGSAYDLDFPVDREFLSRPLQGTWEDGYRLSVLALEQVKDRPEVFDERNRRMCPVEFEL